ncbi:MAG TPA: tetratricopeptide repeat protein [Kofleriaceae bacterium]|nr:tetratricopeptide repeat protein [Kofleriaceae bacterium]
MSRLAVIAVIVTAVAPARADGPKPPPTSQMLKDYRKHLNAGLAAERAKKWAAAVTELDAAAAVLDGDQRALAELGWSAMNAGDFAKARRADADAVRVAIDPKVKAAALYNLGQIEERTGDKDAALKSYLASLQLRPNKTVADAITRLGASPAAEPPFCKPDQAACDCVLAAAFGDYDKASPPKCETRTPPKIAGAAFQAYWVEQGPWSGLYLLDEHNGLVGIIGGGLDRMRVYEEISLDKAEVRTVSGHLVLWLQTRDKANETIIGSDDSMSNDDDTTVDVTLCVLGDAKTPTRCPLRDVPIEHSHQREHDAKPAVAKVELAIGDDGTATVKLVSGASDPGLDPLVGPHKLW